MNKDEEEVGFVGGRWKLSVGKCDLCAALYLLWWVVIVEGIALAWRLKLSTSGNPRDESVVDGWSGFENPGVIR